MIKNHIVRLAIAEAKKSQCNYRLGAIVLNGNQIVSRGFNRHSTHRGSICRPAVDALHAEQIALRRTGRRQTDTILVVRLILNGFAIAKPCSKCMKLIRRSGIERITYTNRQGGFTTKYLG